MDAKPCNSNGMGDEYYRSDNNECSGAFTGSHCRNIISCAPNWEFSTNKRESWRTDTYVGINDHIFETWKTLLSIPKLTEHVHTITATIHTFSAIWRCCFIISTTNTYTIVTFQRFSHVVRTFFASRSNQQDYLIWQQRRFPLIARGTHTYIVDHIKCSFL